MFLQTPLLGQTTDLSLHDIDLPGRAGLFAIMYDPARVGGWNPYKNLHHLAQRFPGEDLRWLTAADPSPIYPDPSIIPGRF